MHVEIDRIADPARMKSLAADLERVLAERARLRRRLGARCARGSPTSSPSSAPPAAAAGGRGRRDQGVPDAGSPTATSRSSATAATTWSQPTTATRWRSSTGSALGVLRGEKSGALAELRAAAAGAARATRSAKDLLILTKSNSRSTVHRPGYMDYIGVKRYDAAGEVCGEHRFLGLYTSTAYSANPADIPLLRTKVADVIARTGVAAGLAQPRQGADQHPRHLSARRAVPGVGGAPDARSCRRSCACTGGSGCAMFVRRDPYDRFVTCLIYAPREQLHDRAAAQVAGDPGRRIQRHRVGVQRAAVGVDAGAGADHRAHACRAAFPRST